MRGAHAQFLRLAYSRHVSLIENSAGFLLAEHRDTIGILIKTICNDRPSWNLSFMKSMLSEFVAR